MYYFVTGWLLLNPYLNRHAFVNTKLIKELLEEEKPFIINFNTKITNFNIFNIEILINVKLKYVK